jgi:hypothetical protein
MPSSINTTCPEALVIRPEEFAIYGIKSTMKAKILLTAVASCFIFHSAFAFEGRIRAALTRGGLATPLLYTAGTNCLRVEITASDRPYPVDLLALPSGDLTLLFPNNRTFVHAAAVPPMPAMPNPPIAGAMPAMPAMPPPMMKQMELATTGDKTNLLGLACEKFQIKQGGQTMDIWATTQLVPFQHYVQNQPHRFGPQRIEEKWGGLLAAKKLFPLLPSLEFDNGAEHYRFEVQSITPERVTPGDAEKLFQPPPGYHELRPLPF